MNPIENGDDHLTPLNMVPAEMLQDLIDQGKIGRPSNAVPPAQAA